MHCSFTSRQGTNRKMDDTYTITLRIDPPRTSRLRPLQVHRGFSIDYDHGYGAAFRPKEDVPDDAEDLARGLLDSEALAHRLEHLRKLDIKTDEQRDKVKTIIKHEMVRALAEGIRDKWVEEMVDEIFDKIDDDDA